MTDAKPRPVAVPRAGAESRVQPTEPFLPADDLPTPAELVETSALEDLTEEVSGLTDAVEQLCEKVGRHDRLIADLLTRMTPVEQATRTPLQQAKLTTIVGARYSSYLIAGGAVLGVLAKAFPNVPVLQQIAELWHSVMP